MEDKSKDLISNDDLLKLLGDTEPEAFHIPDIPIGDTDTHDVPDIPNIPDVPVDGAVIGIPSVHIPIESDIKVEIVDAKVESIKQDDNSEYVRELLSNFKSVSKTIFNRFEEDREEIQDVLDYLKDKVYNDNDATEAHVTALSNTLRTKADSSTNAVKLLDAYSKLLAAGKNSFGGSNKSSSPAKDAIELMKFLQKEQFPDEK